MNCLVISDTFPNRLEPWRGPYNRRQMECLANLCQVTVINPLPWTQLLCDASYWSLLSKPDMVLDGIFTYHPIFWYLPAVGRSGAWRLVLGAANRALRDNTRGRYDIVLATFAYPHGLAAKYLSEDLGVPYIIKVRGSDIHSLPSSGHRRDKTAEALRDAAAVVAVSSNLAEIALELGASAKNLYVLPNGVDADSFPMMPRHDARRKLGIAQQKKILLFVGHLLPVKGLDILVDALQPDGKARSAPTDVTLTIAGDGPMRRWLAKRLARDGLGDPVRLIGHIAREEVALWMNAADALVLPSRNEGCPNVVLEALSCGTPVIASRVGAIPDLLDESCGIQVAPGNARELFRGIQAVLSKEWDRGAIRRRVEAMSWEANAAKLHEILAQAVATSR